jgi:hypothetical protein
MDPKYYFQVDILGSILDIAYTLEENGVRHSSLTIYSSPPVNLNLFPALKLQLTIYHLLRTSSAKAFES